MATSYSDGLGELTFETEQIDVTMMTPYPDPRWRFTDAADHEHHVAENGDYPTLRFVIDSQETYYCQDCGEDHTDTRGHYECLLCAETIEPGTTVDTHRRYQPGRTAYFLDGRPIREEQAQQIIERRRTQ